MRRFLSRIGAGTTALLAALAMTGDTAAQSTVQFTVSGTSTVRGWTCEVPGRIDVTEGGGDAVPGLSDGVSAATLTVNVADFECPQDEMQEHLREAMRYEEFPTISFTLEGYEPGATVTTNGSLTILDTTRPVSFGVTARAAGSGVQISGELPLSMTDFGVEPPEVMLGLLVVRPSIRIQFSGMIDP